MTGKVMNHRIEPTTATSLNQCNFKVHSTQLSLHPQISLVLSPHQRSFILEKTDTIMKITACQNANN